MRCTHQPDGIEVYTAVGRHAFRLSDHPGATGFEIICQGGHGGRAADGTPGSPGTTGIRFMSADELRTCAPTGEMTVHINPPGKGGPGAEDGQPGYVLIAVYTCDCAGGARRPWSSVLAFWRRGRRLRTQG